MFKSFAKFFAGRSSSQQSNTSDQSIELSAQEETSDTTNAPFFASTDVASQFAYDLNKKSHKHFYSKHFGRIQNHVSALKNNYYSAEHFRYSIPEREMSPIAEVKEDQEALEANAHREDDAKSLSPPMKPPHPTVISLASPSLLI